MFDIPEVNIILVAVGVDAARKGILNITEQTFNFSGVTFVPYVKIQAFGHFPA